MVVLCGARVGLDDPCGSLSTWDILQFYDSMVYPQIASSHLPREVGESPPLELIKNCGDVTLRDMVRGHEGGGLMVRLGDRGAF